MRLITWNVAGRVGRQPQQAEVIARAGADVVALQEVTPRTLEAWRASFRALGFAGCESSLDGVAAPSGRRRLGVLTATRAPLRRLGPPPGVPWAERVLCCALADLEIVNLHSPIAPAPELAKVRTHEAVAAYLVQGLPRRGWVDAFRALHGYAERQASWTFADDRGGWRLDHVLVH